MIPMVIIAVLLIGIVGWLIYEFLIAPVMPECYGSRFCIGDCERCSIAHLTKTKRR